MSKKPLLRRKLYRGGHSVSLIDNMKTRWKFFLRGLTDKRLAVFVPIGLVLLISAVVLQGIHLHELQTLNERRASSVEIETELAGDQTRFAQLLNDKAELTTEFLNLTEQVNDLEVAGVTGEQINKVKAEISRVEAGLEEFDARAAAVQAQIGAVQEMAVAREGDITVLEQTAGRSLSLSGLILSIGMFFFSWGLAAVVYNLPKQRA